MAGGWAALEDIVRLFFVGVTAIRDGSDDWSEIISSWWTIPGGDWMVLLIKVISPVNLDAIPVEDLRKVLGILVGLCLDTKLVTNEVAHAFSFESIANLREYEQSNAFLRAMGVSAHLQEGHKYLEYKDTKDNKPTEGLPSASLEKDFSIKGEINLSLPLSRVRALALQFSQAPKTQVATWHREQDTFTQGFEALSDKTIISSLGAQSRAVDSAYYEVLHKFTKPFNQLLHIYDTLWEADRTSQPTIDMEKTLMALEIAKEEIEAKRRSLFPSATYLQESTRFKYANNEPAQLIGEAGAKEIKSAKKILENITGKRSNYGGGGGGEIKGEIKGEIVVEDEEEAAVDVATEMYLMVEEAREVQVVVTVEDVVATVVDVVDVEGDVVVVVTPPHVPIQPDLGNDGVITRQVN
ncbi:hypothetical protein [Nitrosomonas sp.]|uniref:hypothetical protein n=1 Tax=Nitrosomonas sp. TaxID=42353 RepID=UPI002600AE98|nr:hypothetical protein [Nitrosomonas sp.]